MFVERKLKKVLFYLTKNYRCNIKLDIYLRCKHRDEHVKAYALDGTFGHKDKPYSHKIFKRLRYFYADAV